MSKKFASLVFACSLTLTGVSQQAYGLTSAVSRSMAVGGSNPLPQARAVGGSNPLPQAVGGSNPLPQAVGGTWVYVVLSVLGIL